MWNETLIESMGHHQNGKRWLTVQLAAIVHAAIVGVLIAGSFWYVDRMSLPEPNKISAVLYETIPGGPPPALGVRHSKNSEISAMSKPVTASTPATQEQIVPETINNISDVALPSIENNGNDLPVGDPDGVQGGDPNSTLGFGGGNDESNGSALNPDPIHQSTEVGVNLPQIINQVKPEYPESLRLMRKEGMVILEAVITKTGVVQDAKILQSTHPLFTQSAMNAVLQWKYRPATLNGRPIAVYFKVTVRFTLR
ncbi:MAG TPA: energy transducer TonB [Acidobacteriota bacterium]|nr:energy transducer TonB [Acidobacteriota bacterium]